MPKATFIESGIQLFRERLSKEAKSVRDNPERQYGSQWRIGARASYSYDKKKKINNDFQCFGNELTAYVKKNNFSFRRIIFEERKKIGIKLNKLISLANRKISIFFTCRICRIKTGRLLFHNDESEASGFCTVSFSADCKQARSSWWSNWL